MNKLQCAKCPTIERTCIAKSDALDLSRCCGRYWLATATETRPANETEAELAGMVESVIKVKFPKATPNGRQLSEEN